MSGLEVTQIKSIYHITLNRPEVRNAFNPGLISEITQAFRGIPAGVRAVVFRGQGKVFCSGADLEWMRSMVHYTLEENRQDSLLLHEMFQAMQDCPAPVISVVHGAAMGGALGLMACSDIVLAEQQTQFCFSEVRLGIAPAVISDFILSKTSVAKVSPWMISGKVFMAAEAIAMGLVHQTGSLEEIENQLHSWTQAFLDAAPGAVWATRELIRSLTTLEGEERKSKTTALIAERRVSAEGQEGLKSFLEKRQPSWKETI